MQQEKDAHISPIRLSTELPSQTSLRIPQSLRVLQVILDMVTVITMAVVQVLPVEVTVMAIVPAVVVMQIPTRVRPVVPLQIVGAAAHHQVLVVHQALLSEVIMVPVMVIVPIPVPIMATAQEGPVITMA